MSHAHANDAQLIRLLAHREWLEQLAVRLVGDEHAAADLVQDTLLAVITHRPAEGASLRAWLRTVLVRGVIRHRKSEACRRAREIARENKDAFPSPEEITERTDAHHQIVSAVLALDEPYKSTLLLRFYDGYPPRVIAERTNTPVETVKTRIKRGLAQLRLALEEDGERGMQAVALLLAPLLLRPLPKLAVSTQLGVFACACLLAIGGGWLFVGGEAATHPADSELGLANEATSGELARALEDAPPTPTIRRNALEEAPVPVLETDTAAVPDATYDAVALDVDGEPLANFDVGVIPGEFGAYRDSGVEYIELEDDDVVSLGKTDPEGRFRVPSRYRGWLLCTTDDEYSTLLPAIVATNPTAPNALVCGPAFTLEGLVLDSTGHPVVGATVRVDLPRAFRARFDLPLTNSIQTTWHARSDESGMYRLESLTHLSGATITAGGERHGFITTSVPQPTAGHAVLDLELGGLVGTRLTARGVVRDQEGSALSGVCVHYGADHLHTDSTGRFEVYSDAPGSGNRRFPCPPARLAFHRDGYSALLIERDAASGRFGLDLELTLAPQGDPVTGVVRDSTGRPVAGAHVALSIPAADPLSKRYNCARTDLSDFESSVRTDDSGRFTLPCPADTEVGLHCTDADSFGGTHIDGGLRAGNEVELTLPAAEDLITSTVLVVDHESEPVQDATVMIFANESLASPDGDRPHRDAARLTVTTDADGRAQLPPLAPEGLTVLIESPSSFPTSMPFPIPTADDPVVLRVPLRCWIGVDLTSAGDLYRAPECYGRFLDERGEVVHSFEQHGHGGAKSPLLSLDRGRSAVVSVPSNVRTLEILRGPQLIGLASVSPVPGETTWVRELH